MQREASDNLHKSKVRKIGEKMKPDMIRQFEKRLELITKISYLCLAICTFNPFLYISSVQPVFVKLTLVLGAGLILVRLFRYRTYKKMPGVMIMVLFCGSFALSAFMNRQYGIVDNGKWIIWTAIQFFALYVCDVERDTEEYRKEFELLAHIMIVYSVFSSVYSLWMLITRYSGMIESADGEFIICGFTWGRLWGNYTDPNYGAEFAVIIMILSLLFLVQKKGLLRILYVVSLTVNYLYLIFSDSRTGEIALFCSMVLCVFMWLCHIQKKGRSAGRYGTALAGAVCIAAVLLGGEYLARSGYNTKLAPVFAETFSQDDKKQTEREKSASNKEESDTGKKEAGAEKKESGTGKKGATTIKQDTSTVKKEVGRKEDLEKDVTNGRLSLWKSAIEIWRTSPVYGTGYSTVVHYAREHTPSTYLINNPLGEYISMHNAYLNTLVYQGMIGFVLLLAIAGRILQYVIRPFMRKETDDILYLTAMLACVGTVAVAMFFLLEGLYTNSMGSFALWTFSGYLVQYAYRNREEKKA